jgi:hypothetical protein
LHSAVNADHIDKIWRSTKLGFVVYIGATAIAFFYPVAALIINLLLWLVWITLSITEKSE